MSSLTNALYDLDGSEVEIWSWWNVLFAIICTARTVAESLNDIFIFPNSSKGN